MESTISYLQNCLSIVYKMLPPLSTPSVFWMLFSCLVLICFQVQGEDFQTESLSPRFSCPQGSVGYNNYCYAFFVTPKSWMDASIACQNWRSSHLASVLSEFEASFLARFLTGESNEYAYIWIGLHDPTEKGNGWQWSNHDIMNYMAWQRTPPTYPSPGYCGSVMESSGFKKWKDFNCDEELPYVCKFNPWEIKRFVWNASFFEVDPGPEYSFSLNTQTQAYHSQFSFIFRFSFFNILHILSFKRTIIKISIFSPSCVI